MIRPAPLGALPRREEHQLREPGQDLRGSWRDPVELLSVLDGDDTPHKEPGRKQEAGHTKAIQSALRVREIQKLLARLKHLTGRHGSNDGVT
jgi:hypothetical protein